jgi:hypothetical protein
MSGLISPRALPCGLLFGVVLKLSYKVLSILSLSAAIFLGEKVILFFTHRLI